MNFGSMSERKRAAESTNPGHSRSVVDYETEDQLLNALLAVEGGMVSSRCAPVLAEISHGEPVQKIARTGEMQAELSRHLDWTLPHFDATTTETQSIKDELKRLSVLKSYVVLDSEREEAFERITSLASRIFDVPIALVSLVDLGRQWFMSNLGLGDVRETPRRTAFCAHAILNKETILVVPDATIDFRFKENPLVTGPPHIRFYAGSPLLSPEGYKLGTLCIIDTTARPNGLSQEHRDTLKDLSDMTMKVMVDRRFQKDEKEDPQTLVAYTAHDLMTPLSCVQLSLTLLKDDNRVKANLTTGHLELLKTASACSDLMVRICKKMLRDMGTADQNSVEADVPTITDQTPTTNMEELFKSVNLILDPSPKRVPVILTVQSSVPNIVAADDLMLFRCAVNLLTNAIDRTALGSVHLTARLDESSLLFECEDTGTDIPIEQYQDLFQPCGVDDGNLRVSLSSIASAINSCNGEYGFRPRGVAENGGMIYDSNGYRRAGSIFWFSIPCFSKNSTEQVSSVSAVHIQQPTSGLGGVNATMASMQLSQDSVNSKNEAVSSNDVILDPDFEPEPLMCSTDACDDVIAQQALAQAALYGLNNEWESQEQRLAAAKTDTVRSIDEAPRIRIKRALVIDDSTVVRKSLAQAFQKLGYNVSEAGDGIEGLKTLKEAVFDIVLCDLLMPHKDGLECVTQYRMWETQNRSWFQQFIVGISTHANVNDSGQATVAGMDAFRPKPISMKVLTELEQSELATMRTKTLDELEGSASRADVECSNVVHQRFPRNSGGTASKPHIGTPVCLIASSSPSFQSTGINSLFEKSGWKVVTAQDGSACLKLLQLQNWDAVLVEDNLSAMTGAQCVAAFRQWEGQNRANGQKNLILVCEGNIPSPSDTYSFVHPPDGCNACLGKPVVWNEFQHLISKDSSQGMNVS